MCSGSEAGSYLRLIDSCITQLKAQGPSRTCNESKEEEGGYVEGEGAEVDVLARERQRECRQAHPDPFVPARGEAEV